MKRIFLILSISIILFTLMSCGESPTSKALNSSNEFLKMLFTFEDTDKIIDEQDKDDMMMKFIEKLKPYMTEKGYKRHIASQDLFLSYTAAAENKCNIRVSNIKTSLKKEYKEDKYYIIDYSLDITAAPLNDDKETMYPVTGEITVVQADNKFLVEHHRYLNYKEWMKFAIR